MVRPVLIVLCITVLQMSIGCGHAIDLKELEVVQIVPVEGPENAQPSGLARCGDTLFTISDKHDDTIFRIELRDEKAVLVPHIQFQVEPLPDLAELDLEGIACDEAGNFYLASETAFRILKVQPDGSTKWISPDLKPFGQEKGLFQQRNANIEGIAYAGEQRFYLTAEREPRGLLDVDLSGETPFVTAFACDQTYLELPQERNPDYTGLYVWREQLYGLVRNAEAVCRIEVDPDGPCDGECRSYHHVVSRDSLRFTDMRFGHAEGLCLDDSGVYLILDNNNDARVMNPADRRSLLLVFKPFMP